jgi:hypothetical protein
MDDVALVEAAFKDGRHFKDIVAVLDTRKPNEEAAKNVIEAFRRGRCETWLAACLLGHIRHPVGYETAQQILLSNPNTSSAESYAGVAMAAMLGEAAYADLRRILFGDHPWKVRRGAVFGMRRIASLRLANDLVQAYREDRLKRHDVDWGIAQCHPTDDWLLAFLRDDDERLRKLACAVVENMVIPNYDHSPPGLTDAEAIRELLADTAFSMMPSRRTKLSAWVANA